MGIALNESTRNSSCTGTIVDSACSSSVTFMFSGKLTGTLGVVRTMRRKGFFWQGFYYPLDTFSQFLLEIAGMVLTINVSA